MSLPKLNLNKIIILCLLALNFFLCFMLIKTHRENRQIIHSYRADAIMYLDALTSSMQSQATIGTLALSTELDGLGIFDEIKNRRSIGLFIPPHPCDACLDRELDMIFHYQQENDDVIVIVAPQFRKRDLQARLGANPKRIIIPYDIECISYAPIKELESLIYFVSGNGSIDDIFITNKNIENVSSYYLQKYGHVCDID